VHGPGRSGHERARACPDDVVAEDELRLALEDVERVDVIRMGVGRDALEVRRKGQVEHLELGQLREHAMPPHPFAVAGPDHDAAHGQSVSYERLFV
jgi:hypothetical protein